MEVARRGGMSAAAPYRHFSDKGQLLLGARYYGALPYQCVVATQEEYPQFARAFHRSGKTNCRLR